MEPQGTRKQLLKFNPFRYTDYKILIPGPFREELFGQKYTALKNPLDNQVHRELRKKRPVSIANLGIPNICVSCLGAVFANLRYSWTGAKLELPPRLFHDRDRFELLVRKADFIMRNPAKLDILDTR